MTALSGVPLFFVCLRAPTETCCSATSRAVLGAIKSQRQPLQSKRAQSISYQEQVRHQNAKNTQHRDQQLPYFTNLSSNVTENYSASVLVGELCPWRHLTAYIPCSEAVAMRSVANLMFYPIN